MSVRSGSSRSTRDYREIRIPNSKSVKALIYFCGRDPRKAKSIRRYYDEDFDARSTGSGSGSMFSWSSGTSGVYLVETTGDYWTWDEPSPAAYTAAQPKKRKSGRSSRASRHSSASHSQPAGTWTRHATVENDEDDDDSSSDGSVEDYNGGGGGMPFAHPHPGMMPPHPGPHPGPPPGAFQPGYGMFPSAHATPHPMPPQGGFSVPPPPPPMHHMPTPQQPGGFAPPPPPPPGGHFVPGRGGIQVFVDG
ncbi:hypothetical protein N0V88_005281 [Collariella sp. IMI 366227]|nr:hypothetical protein N0V88_005281 [Collariella sp. IMI 366227]